MSVAVWSSRAAAAVYGVNCDGGNDDYSVSHKKMSERGGGAERKDGGRSTRPGVGWRVEVQ